jgi:hypothetical protein
VTGVYNWTINQGTDWSATLTWQSGGSNVNLTGWSAHMQIRPGNAGSTSIIYADLSSGNGSIVLGGAAGTIVITMGNTTTSALVFQTAQYDLKLTNASGLVTRLLQGTITLSPEVTV